MRFPWNEVLRGFAVVAAVLVLLGFMYYMIALSGEPDHTSRDNAAQARIDCAQHGGVQQIADYYEFVVTCKDGTVVGHDG